MSCTKSTLGRLTIICLIILVIHEGVDELAAWIVGERAELEYEIKEQRKFGYYAKKEMTSLKNEKIEMECCLDRTDGHIRHLKSNLEFLQDEVCKLRGELLRAQNIQAHDSLILQQAEFERVSTQAQVLRLNEALATSKQSQVAAEWCSEEFAQALVALEEKRKGLALELSEEKAPHMEERRQFNIQLSELKGDYEGLQSRFDYYKKVWEDTDAAQDNIARSIRHMTATVKEQKQQLEELGGLLASANEELVHLYPQLAVAPSVRDRAFEYDYEAGMLRLKTYMLANPRTNLFKLDLKKLEPNEVSYRFVDTLECKEMPDAFPHPLLPE